MTNKRLEDTNEDIDLMKLVEEYERDEKNETNDQKLDQSVYQKKNPYVDTEEDSVFPNTPNNDQNGNVTRMMHTKELSMEDKTLTIMTSNRQETKRPERTSEPQEEVVLSSIKKGGKTPNKKPDNDDKQNKIITGVIIGVVVILLIACVVLAMNFLGGSKDDQKKDDNVTDVVDKNKDKDKDKPKKEEQQKPTEKEEEIKKEEEAQRDCSAENAKLDEYIKVEEKKILTLQSELKSLYTEKGSREEIIKGIESDIDGFKNSIKAIEEQLKNEELTEVQKQELEKKKKDFELNYTNAGEQLNDARSGLIKVSAQINEKESAITEANKRINDYKLQKNTCN